MDNAFNEITQSLPDAHHWVRITVRLSAALIVGTLVGLQRELTHKPAGLRTHMLVALGTSLFLISAAESGMSSADLSRLVQGIVTGIGFLGGGAILKLATEREIHGLTTAAGVWMTAAASVAAALGQVVVALVGTIVGLVVLITIRSLEQHLSHDLKRDSETHPPTNANPKDVA